ncbi:hypothetical protein RDI58_000253 [Solanum bulbocastanum]|uniref:Uncharacterized protein n=1 Tax=Solanum bulbocastanum TaxID=147425 RepID=A0AAN8U6W4_SOLBU
MALQQSPENHDSNSRKRKSVIRLEEKIEKKKEYDEEEGEVVTSKRNFDSIDNFVSAEDETQMEEIVEDEIPNIEEEEGIRRRFCEDDELPSTELSLSMAGSSKTEISISNSNSNTVFKKFSNCTPKEWLSL